MYFHLEELTLDGEVHLTELTWSYRLHRVNHSSHYPVRSPGADDADALLTRMDPSYRPRQRYGGLVIAKAFLTDYDSLPNGALIYGTSTAQCLALEEYLSGVPHPNRAYVENFRVMDEHLPSGMVRGLVESLESIRNTALGAI